MARCAAGSVSAHSVCSMPSLVRALSTGWPAVAACGGQPGGHRARATVVEQEDRLQVGLGGLHQLAPAEHRPGHHVLVRQHDPRLGRGQPHRPDQPALQHAVAVRPGPDQPLLVQVQRGLLLGDQDALGQPGIEQPGRLLVLRARLAGHRRRQDEPDHVVRVGVAQMLGAVLTDDVVRWGGDLGESGHPLLGITDTTEGREREPGWARHRWFLAGRKDLHICQKHRWAARIPARRKIRRSPGDNPAPHGDAYTWYQRGLELLGRGSAAAAAQLLERAAEAEPGARSVLEALGRAQFDTRRYADARADIPADRRGQPERRLCPLRARPGPGPGR